MNGFMTAMRKYAVFSGRSTRSEYWYFVLFLVLIQIGLMIVDTLLGTFNSAAGIGLLSGIFSLATFIPCLAVSVRRLHDTDRSGWWLLLGLIPVIGGLVLLVFFVQDSQPGTNRFGPNPKAIGGLVPAS